MSRSDLTQAQIVADPESTAEELYGCAVSYPREVLAHVSLDLLALENPDLVLRIKAVATDVLADQIADPRSERYPLRAYREIALEAVSLALWAWESWSPRYQGVGSSLMRPEFAVRVARDYHDGITDRRALAWAARYARTFSEAYISDGADNDERRWWRRAGNVSGVCALVCAQTRADLWLCVKKAVPWHQGVDTPLQVAVRCREYAERLATLAPKKTRTLAQKKARAR